MDLNITRAEIERRIEDEEAVLEAVSSLLRQGALLRSWPDDQLGALLRALDEGGLRGFEAQKAFALRRHLFGSEPVALPAMPKTPPHPLEGRRAERLRADLGGLVRLRAGLRCLDGP